MCEERDKKILADATYFRMVLADGRWEYIEPKKFTGVVMLVAVTPEEKLVLIEQYRIPVGAWCVEIPAGLVGDETPHAGESLHAAAGRELEEETGYRAGRIERLCSGAPSAGSNSVILTFFGCTDLERVGPGGGVDDEDIRVHEVPLDEVDAFLAARESAGAVVDLKVYTALYYAPRLLGR
jgi:ADP-ribose pyrophosphatase